MDLSILDVVELLVLGGGCLVGYGTLKAKIGTMEKRMDTHCSGSNERFTRLENRVNVSERGLAGMESDINNIKTTLGNIDSKMDKVVETLLDKR